MLSTNPRNVYRRAHRAANLEQYRKRESASYTADFRQKKLQSSKAWAKANPAKVRAQHRRLKFGITQAEWDAQFEAQDFACAICSAEDPGSSKDWCTDHCHKYGYLRGILCHPCNRGLGAFKDRPEVLRAAARYLVAYAR